MGSAEAEASTEVISFTANGGQQQQRVASDSPPPMGLVPATELDASKESEGITASRKRAAMLYEVLIPHSRMPLLHRVWMTFESPSFSSAAFWYAQFSLVIITVSTISFCLETEINCKPFSVREHGFVTEQNCSLWEDLWLYCEVVAVICFTIELLLRFISSPSQRIFLGGVMNWVDFVAILPFFLELLLSTAVSSSSKSGNASLAADSEDDNPLAALSVFRVIRLVRVFRVFKMGKASTGTPSTVAGHGASPDPALHGNPRAPALLAAAVAASRARNGPTGPQRASGGSRMRVLPCPWAAATRARADSVHRC